MADFRTFDPCNLLAPVPAVMVSCRAPEADAKPNIITVAWVGTVNSEPPMMSISVRGNRFSHDLIAKSGEFVVNLVVKPIARRWISAVSGRGVMWTSGRSATLRPCLR